MYWGGTFSPLYFWVLKQAGTACTKAFLGCNQRVFDFSINRNNSLSIDDAKVICMAFKNISIFWRIPNNCHINSKTIIVLSNIVAK